MSGARTSGAVMRIAAALLLALVTVLACGPGGAAGAATLRAALPDDLSTIDPFAFPGVASATVLRQVYESLTRIEADGRAAPALAAGWDSPDGGRTWRIALRPGVRFHSGRPVEAADVVRTWERHLARRPQPGFGAFYLQGIEGAQAVRDGSASSLSGVTVPDARTLVVRLTAPDALFPYYPIPIVDRGMEAEHGAGWIGRASGGTGPFRLSAWRPGLSVRLEAHSAHWEGRPAVEAVEFSILTEPATLLARFDAGLLDLAPLPDGMVRSAARDPSHAALVRDFPRAQIRYLGLNQSLYPPFRDKRVREAVRLALDRRAAAEGLHAGRAELTDGLTTPGLGGYRSVLPLGTADPQRARALLAEAGHAGGRGLPPLQIAGTAGVRDEATYYAAQLTAVLGIPVGVRILERGSFVAAINEGREALFFSGWTADYPDPIDQLTTQWLSTSPTNRTRWSNPAFDRLIGEARGQADPQTRHRLYRAAEQILFDEVAGIALPVPRYAALVRSGVSGVAIRPDGTLDLRGARLP